MGDRVAVMRKGELQQADEPQELYDHPVNLFVAGFIGSPAMNLLEATLQGSNGGMSVKAGSQEISLSQETLAQRPALRSYEGRDVVLGIRPEDLEDFQLAGEIGARRPAQRHRHAARVARLRRSWCTSPSTRRPAITEDVKELAEDVGDDRPRRPPMARRARP